MYCEIKQLPRVYVIGHSVAVAVLAVVLLILDIHVNVSLSLFTINEGLPVYGFCIAMAVLNVVLDYVNHRHTSLIMSILHFTATFLAFFVWVPRLMSLSSDILVRGHKPLANQMIAGIVLGLVESIICFVYFVLSILQGAPKGSQPIESVDINRI